MGSAEVSAEKLRIRLRVPSFVSRSVLMLVKSRCRPLPMQNSTFLDRRELLRVDHGAFLPKRPEP
jgi:hypothetical protein